MSGIKICKANAPTALPMDHAAEILQTEPTWNFLRQAHVESPRMVDLNLSNPNSNANDTMGAMIPTTSNTDSLTNSGVRSRPILNNSSRCPEHKSGPHLKDNFTPRKSYRNVRRQNMVRNIEGYKKWVRKCRKQATYRHNLQVLCQGREDNPLHIDAFNELIENLKEKNKTWSKTMFNYDHSVSRTLFMDENSDRGH